MRVIHLIKIIRLKGVQPHHCIPHEASLIVRRFMFEILIFHKEFASKVGQIISIEFSKRPLHAVRTFEGSEESVELLLGHNGLAYCIWPDGQFHQTDVSNLHLASRVASKASPANATAAAKKKAAKEKKKAAAAKKNAAKPKKGAKAAKKETAKAAKEEETESDSESESSFEEEEDPGDAKREEEDALVPAVAKPPAKATAAAIQPPALRKYWHDRNNKMKAEADAAAAAAAAAPGAAAPAAVAPAPAAAAPAAAAAAAAAAPATLAKDRDATNM